MSIILPGKCFRGPTLTKKFTGFSSVSQWGIISDSMFSSTLGSAILTVYNPLIWQSQHDLNTSLMIHKVKYLSPQFSKSWVSKAFGTELPWWFRMELIVKQSKPSFYLILCKVGIVGSGVGVLQVQEVQDSLWIHSGHGKGGNSDNIHWHRIVRVYESSPPTSLTVRNLYRRNGWQSNLRSY